MESRTIERETRLETRDPQLGIRQLADYVISLKFEVQGLKLTQLRTSDIEPRTIKLYLEQFNNIVRKNKYHKHQQENHAYLLGIF